MHRSTSWLSDCVIIQHSRFMFKNQQISKLIAVQAFCVFTLAPLPRNTLTMPTYPLASKRKFASMRGVAWKKMRIQSCLVKTNESLTEPQPWQKTFIQSFSKLQQSPVCTLTYCLWLTVVAWTYDRYGTQFLIIEQMEWGWEKGTACSHNPTRGTSNGAWAADLYKALPSGTTQCLS